MSPVLTVVTGATVLTVVGIVSGGAFLMRVLAGGVPANDLQKTFFRAGHAHAGVLVTLGLVVALLTTAAGVSDVWATTGSVLVLSSAILVPAGFFLSVLGTDPRRPGRMVLCIWAGAAVLAVGLLVAGIATVAAGVAAF
ncbi:hypothetical protein G4H71_15585 [Rhodococcus triatomae]|uniref:Integral membrane protein n=1 Tax=Rhodococcus triatomae TaxID=300028 RepID=A0A1G8J684_9NOCA|nr:hypothetical protein [Rhodococcus triatomae]QNG19817.1 hypothetical protein G4H72_14785 [Rhodococcus triatomae]QNG24267.1 hypothetical protein G4H71_15585 [Rhodococcus triatomae]SDI26150.1 hypothetical protein SAMN05444695_10665 [Rhodococcus triatomae]